MVRTSVLPGAPTGRLELLGPFEVPGLAKRHVRLFVPRGYDPSVPQRVLYMFDGQNLFDDGPSFAGGWHLHETVDKLATRDRLAPIVVGIDHGGEQRIRELSPFEVRGESGLLERLLDWIATSLMPTIASRVNVGPGPVHAAIGGSSLGGLAAFYAHFKRADLFGGVVAMSPSFWLGRGRILEWLDRQPAPWVSRVYIDCGAHEGRGAMLGIAERAAQRLSSRGYGADRLRFRADPKGTHSERDWRRRAPSALRWMYRDASRPKSR